MFLPSSVNNQAVPHDALLVLAVALRLCSTFPTEANLNDLGRAAGIVKQFARGAFTPTLQDHLDSMLIDYRSRGFVQRA